MGALDEARLRDASKVRLAFLGLVAVTFLCYSPALRNDLLIWDDSGYILGNSHIRHLDLELVRWAFGEFYLNYWAPLMWFSLALDYAVWGTNPIGYHLTNIVIHALNAGLFFLVSLALLRQYIAARAASRETSVITLRAALASSVLAGLLFAIHPLRVESVAWATERKDVLGLFFGLLAILAYLEHAERLRVRDGTPFSGTSLGFSRHYWLTLAFFCLSLLSKTLVVTLPLVLLVLDWFPLGRLDRRRAGRVVLEKVPLLIVAGLSSLTAMKSQSKAIFTFDQIDLTTRVLNAFKSIMAYLWLTFWPFDLSPFYLHPMHIEGLGAEYALSMVLFVALTLGAVLVRARWPQVLAAWLIYLVTLFPFLGFTQVGPQAMAGRFVYLAGMPIATLLAAGIASAFARLTESRLATAGLVISMTTVLSTSAFLTVREISFWRDDVALWTRVIDLQPHSTGRAYFQRGVAYSARGEWRMALADIDEALAIANRKRYRALDALYGERAHIMAGLDDLDAAIADYTRALEFASGEEHSHLYLERGSLYRRQGRVDLAERDFELAAGTARGQSREAP